MLQYPQEGYGRTIYQSIFGWNRFHMKQGSQHRVTSDLVTQGQNHNHCFAEFIGSDSTENRIGN